MNNQGFQRFEDEDEVEINTQQNQQQNLEKSTVRMLIQQKQEQLQQLDQQKLMKYLKIILSTLVLLGIIYIISYIIYGILDLIDSYIIMFLILTAWYFILASLASLGFFIGQFWFVKREILNGINQMPLFDFGQNFQDLKSLIEYIQKPSMEKGPLIEEWQKASSTIQLGQYLEHLKVDQDRELTNNQKVILGEINYVVDILKQIQCEDKQKKCNFTNLYDLLTSQEQFKELVKLTDSSNFIRYPNHDQDFIKNELLRRIQSIIETIQYFNRINREKRDQYFFEYDPIVSFPLFQEYMRSFLNSESFHILGQDKKKIDCVFIPSPKNKKVTTTSNVVLKKFMKTNEPPIMIMLNKNSCYFEQEAFASLVKFYLNLGINVVSMNYRGYGVSEGYPWITDIEQDGENLVRYIRDKYKPSKLGINGWSMGGMFATYLANKCNLDFLFADRTFSRPCEAARYLMENRPEIQKTFPYLGKFANVLLKNLPYQNWGRNSGKNFVEFRGHKLLAYDPNDEIIPYLASLKNSVTNELFDKMYSPPLYEGIQRMLNYNQKYKRLEIFDITKDQTKTVYKELLYMKEIINLQQKGIGNGIGDELKRVFKILSYDKLSLFDIVQQHDNLVHESLQQFLINILVYEIILSPNSIVDKLKYFIQELNNLQTNMEDFYGETGIKQKINKCIPHIRELFIKIQNLCTINKPNIEQNATLIHNNTKIMSVNMGHNSYFEAMDFQIYQEYLEEVEFVPKQL